MDTTRPAATCLLTVNGGSSSLRFALFPLRGSDLDPPRPFCSGRVERIGLPGTRVTLTARRDGESPTLPVPAPGLEAVAHWLIDWLEAMVGLATIAGIAHRVVHGGARHVLPERITPFLLTELRGLTPMDRDHLPGAIALIEHFGRRLPEVPQVACFDTAFHHEMPRVAQIVPIPRRYEAAGERRYGFHGLSYTYLMEELARAAGAESAAGRVVLAHLGSGSSMAAVRAGCPIDTTIGLTPASGLVMSTRAGDVDPGLPGFLGAAEGITLEQFQAMVNH
jgi:acetate kinase